MYLPFGILLCNRRDDRRAHHTSRLPREEEISDPPRPRVGLPGARFEVDNRRTLSSLEIFEGQNEEDIYRSPLTEIGVEILKSAVCAGR